MDKCKSLELPNNIYTINLCDYLFCRLVTIAFLQLHKEIISKKFKFEEQDESNLEEFLNDAFYKACKLYFAFGD